MGVNSHTHFIVVRLKSWSEATLASVETACGGSIGKRIEPLKLVRIVVPDSANPAACLRQLAKHPEVVHAYFEPILTRV